MIGFESNKECEFLVFYCKVLLVMIGFDILVIVYNY